MKTELITPERIDELLRFLPMFERPGREFVERWGGGEKTSDGVMTMPFPVYLADVEEFFRLASQPWWCDYQYALADAGAMLENDGLVQSAGIDQIKTMITYCARGERFCDGHWGAVLRSGRVIALLKRLQVLRSSM
jgi:hypothetical protein